MKIAALSFVVVAAGLIPSVAGATTTTTGSWYCFGQKATKAVPDVAGYWYTDSHGVKQWSPPVFNGTPGKKDVIVTTESADEIWGIQTGDIVCSRGGDDTVQAGDTFVNPKTGWNRIKVDLGAGNDVFDVSNEGFDENLRQTGVVEVHGGPGNDTIDGGEGNDLLFPDGYDRNTTNPIDPGRHFDAINCGDGTDKILYSTTSSWGALACEAQGRTSAYQSHAQFRTP
jgi:Ca2+-binding RTX toxin-like protein